MGAFIECPHCGDKPSQAEVHIEPWQRWKWLTGHIIDKHSRPVAVPERQQPGKVIQLAATGTGTKRR